MNSPVGLGARYSAEEKERKESTGEGVVPEPERAAAMVARPHVIDAVAVLDPEDRRVVPEREVADVMLAQALVRAVEVAAMGVLANIEPKVCSGSRADN